MKKILLLTTICLGLVASIFVPVLGAASLAIMPFMGGSSLAELEAAARRDLSSFDGQAFEGGYPGYTGMGDDLLDFGGGGDASFLNLPLEENIFTLTLVNANAATRYAYLCPGILYTPGVTLAGVPLDGAFNDSAGNGAGLTRSGSPKTVAEFMAYIHKKPVQIARIKIASTVATQITQQITVQPMSPFRTLASRVLNPSSFQTQDTFQDKVVVFDVPNLILANDQQITYPIVGTSTCTITFYAGAILNTSKTLESRVSQAKATITNAIASGSTVPVNASPIRMKSLNGRAI